MNGALMLATSDNSRKAVYDSIYYHEAMFL